MRKFLFFLFLSIQLSAQEYSIQKGVVTDSLKVSDTLSETYAIYLPTNFQTDKNWPILFLFDGKGRGRATAQLFKNAAEEQGYILVSSNDISEEKELKENLQVATRIVSAVVTALPIDLEQISAAGSNEGGKVATSVPVLFRNIHGVIAVKEQWVKPNLLDRKNQFTFIGIVGEEDFSSTGIYGVANELKPMKFPVEIYTYDGKDDWPNPTIVSSVVGSLSLEAMGERLRPVDRELIDRLYQQDLSRVNKLISTVQLVQAHQLLETLKEKYSGLHEISEIEDKLNFLRKSRNYISQKREYEEVLEKEIQDLDLYSYYMDTDINTSNFENLGWWNYQKVSLDSIAERGGAEGKMAQRMKGFLAELADSYREQLAEEKGTPLESKMVASMIATIYDPHNYRAYKNIITLSAQDDDFDTALYYLEEMLKNGYDNVDALYEIPGTLGLKLTREYNQLIEKYLGTSRYYDR